MCAEQYEAALISQDDTKPDQWKQVSPVPFGNSRFLETTLILDTEPRLRVRRERRFVCANRAMVSLFGLPSAEIIGKTFLDLNCAREVATDSAEATVRPPRAT